MKKCPHCSIELPVSPNENWQWVCPECNFLNNEHPVYFNCENCHYGPKMAHCPNCKKLVDLDNFLFTQILPDN